MGGLAANLIDRARYVRPMIAGPRVEGRSPVATVTGPWLACRLVPGPSPEQTDEPGGRIAVRARAELVTGPDGQDLQAADLLEIRSAIHGTATWRVTAAPQLAARRSVRAALFTVERTVEQTPDSVLA